ncbi:hypothetical protein SCLCIDRAFT_1224114 [Scleroderma citrinum Foug A]|uniref:Uncharacterized protein n=1 Tax=Scleroderma citrinum Foug A TaxID=1036808 RepID=A0A0C3CTW1_9AGAM|nr:hypothetical protein SCLCIDRAFT_1224114 [Scleroderma citrinum Foug A]
MKPIGCQINSKGKSRQIEQKRGSCWEGHMYLDEIQVDGNGNPDLIDMGIKRWHSRTLYRRNLITS